MLHLSQLDKESFIIMRRWNLDNLDYILSTITNKQMRVPYWYYYLPKDYDGIIEALLSLVVEDDMEDSLDASMKLIAIEELPRPVDYLRMLIAKAKVNEGEGNWLLGRYVVYCEKYMIRSRKIYSIIPIATERASVLDDKMTLQAVYGDDWRRYYRPLTKVA